MTIARAFTDTFAGIAPGSIAGFVAAQLVGAAVGVVLVAVLYPVPSSAATDVRADPSLGHVPAARVRPSTPIGPETMSDKPSVLFVCIHNAGRSQMAAGFLTHLAGDRIIVRSAGSAPADAVNHAVLEAMAEVGIDLSAQTPKVLTDEAAPARSFRASATWIGRCRIRPGRA